MDRDTTVCCAARNIAVSTAEVHWCDIPPAVSSATVRCPAGNKHDDFMKSNTIQARKTGCTCTLEVLGAEHAEALLAFEQKHKRFFDSLIAMRPPQFYSPEGVQTHIRELQAAYAAGEGYPGVICEQGEVIGRINLRAVDRESQSAYLGYRVAEDRQGEGLACAAVQELVRLAREDFGLKTLRADVLDNNPASAHVLEKHGFVCRGYTEHFLRLHDQCIGCRHYELTL
ncbi:MAG TPA: alanine acetyltransferase [Oceanospirillales bacterium]|nr:alanine acetyltransferase [Oceanospirillaceae bacterium]HBS42355.1 alanine acetyltransferase [Oceanospirillales bacterium]